MGKSAVNTPQLASNMEGLFAHRGAMVINRFLQVRQRDGYSGARGPVTLMNTP